MTGTERILDPEAMHLRPHFPWPSRPLAALNRALAWSFHTGLRKVERLPIPVLSVGNLTSGGTGKTPVTQWLAERLLAWGCKPAIALRGYGGSLSPRNRVVSDGAHIALTAAQAGDEALLHARRLGGVPVLIGRDRVSSGRRAIDLGCDVLLLDDGFQYWRLHRDLDLVLVSAAWLDGERGRRHFPRERCSALQRAHVVLVTKAASHDQREKAVRYLRTAVPQTLVTSCEFHLASSEPIEATPCLAFAALADNEGFFKALRDDGVRVATTIGFPDHHRYRHRDFAHLHEQARQHGARRFVTTEKDSVKIAAGALELPLTSRGLHAHIADEAALLERVRSILKNQK